VIYRPGSNNEGHNILINQAAARYFGFTVQGAVGKTVRVNKEAVHIVAVLNDNASRGAAPGDPAHRLSQCQDQFRHTLGTADRSGHSGRYRFIDRTWHAMAPSTAISRSFLDDSFEKLIAPTRSKAHCSESLSQSLSWIAALGLFGLAAFSVDRRTKEIGIRKGVRRTRPRRGDPAVVAILRPGADRQCDRLALAWYYLRGWLQGFASHIVLSPLYFAAAGLAALLIAWITVLSHALRVARANPIHALRYE